MKKQTNLLMMLTLVVLLLNVPTIAFADNWTSLGHYSISWYNKSQTEYSISTKEELAGVAYLVNYNYTDFSGKTIRLTADIDLTENYWIAIGPTENIIFSGTIDGQGHKIKGVNIIRESGDKNYFGFIGYAKSATIKNISFVGKILIEESTAYYPSRYIGGVTGYAANCNFQNVSCNMSIEYSRKDTNSFIYGEYLGGLAGTINNSTVSYCQFKGFIDVNFGKYVTNYVANAEYYQGANHHVGGIAGYADATHIESCEVSSFGFSIKAGDSKNGGYNAHVGGIVGNYITGRDKCIQFCKSDVGEFSVIYAGSKKGTLYLGGIAGECDVRHAQTIVANCFCTTTSYYAGANSSSTNIYYGGVVGRTKYSNYMTANYSPLDMQINKTSLPTTKGYFGTTSFSSTEMQSNAFLDELNLYPMLELEKNVWARDNSYPYNEELQVSVGIMPTMYNHKVTNNIIYTPSGLFYKTPQKGINIIDGKKIYVK